MESATTTAVPAAGFAPVAEESKVCRYTGHVIYKSARRLIVANLVMAIAALALGGIFAALVAHTRTPAAPGRLDAPDFYSALSAHGVTALIGWPLFMEVALLLLASTVLLNAPVFSARLGWSGFALMVAGTGILETVMLLGKGSVAFTAYVPLVADQWFYVGYLLFAVGVLLGIVNFALTITKARALGIYGGGSLPLVTYGAAAMAILATIAIASGIVALVPAWLLSMGAVSAVEPIVYRTWFWGLGHTLQYVNVIALVIAWYGIMTLALKARPVNERWSRTAFVLYLIFTVPVLGHHFLVDPSLSPEIKVVGGSLMGFGLGIPSLMHGIAVIGGIEATQRRRGYVAGLFGWLKSLPWKTPAMGALACSLVLFAIGGWNGTVATTVPFNLATHNNYWVPAHLHGVVVGGTTLALMGLIYYLLPVLTGRRMWWQTGAWLQPYVYGFGILWMIVAMNVAGFMGVPRRAADIAYGGQAPSGWDPVMNLVGVGALIAVIGGAMFVLNVGMTLLAGKRELEPAMLEEPASVAPETAMAAR